MADTREPSPRSQQVYKDGKKVKNKKDNTKSPGQRLEESKEYIDSGRGPDSQGNLLMIKGSVPGKKHSIIYLKDSVKKSK